MSNKKIKKCTGIILRNRSIVAIEITNKKGITNVTNYSKIILDEDIVENNTIIIDPERFKESVNELLKKGIKGNIKASQIYVTLPEQSTFEHHITVPQDKINDINFIKEMATDYIPIELDDAVFDFVKTSEDKERKEVTFRFIATQGSIIKPLISILKEVGLEVIGIKIDVDCLIRSFNNKLNKHEGDIFLLNMDMERDLICVVRKDGQDDKIIIKRDQNEFKENMKSSVGLSNLEECKNLCLKLKKGEKMESAKEESLKNNLSAYLSDLDKQIEKLLRVSQTNSPLQIKRIYLTGMMSGLPGIREMIEKYFPGIEIKTKIEFTELPDEAERELLEGLGICVEEMENGEKVGINLLPEAKKEELSIAPLIPKIKHYFLIISILLGILIIRMGTVTTSKYIQYRVKVQEAVILNEHALNPYLMSIAKLTQERKRLHDQILSVLDNSIPVSIIMQSLDNENKENVDFQNVSYTSDSTTKESQVELLAEINSREETEAFTAKLEKNNLFADVISPLSNLIGKDERLVRINLSVDENEVIKKYETLNKKATATTETDTPEDTKPNSDNE